jgi:hypothetical protein
MKLMSALVPQIVTLNDPWQILSHVDPLLGNDRKIRRYTIAVVG